MQTALIISGGEYSLPLKMPEYDHVIACDKGAFYAKKAGIKPDIIMGDFDSYEGNIEADFPDIPIIRFPVMKDDTDTIAAARHALAKGYGHMIIICALGGQADHFVSNIQTLNFIAAHGAVGEIYSEKEHFVTLTPEEGVLTVPKREGYGLSIFSLTDRSDGVKIKGTLYDTESAELINSFPLGHGNSITAEKAEISLKNGRLLIIESRLNA